MPFQRHHSYNSYPSYHSKVIKNISKPEKGFPHAPDRRGSVTLEAALVVPLFVFAILSLFYMFEVMAIRTNIRSGLQYAAREAAEEAYLQPFAVPEELEADIVNAVGADRLERSIVVDGSSGIHCEESAMSMVTGILKLKAVYEVRLPLPVFAVPPVKMEESLTVKGWTGYEYAGFSGQKEDIVYITETGMVYHRDYHCNYLELSIRGVQADEIENLRNAAQEKYHVCESCGYPGTGGVVYITDYGNRYHSSLGCSGLKRTIYAIPLSEAVGKGACSKCCR